MCCVCSGMCSHIGPHSYCPVHATNDFQGRSGPWQTIPVFDPTQHQMLQFLVQQSIRMEKLMSDLGTELEELTTAVNGVLVRIDTTVAGLEADVTAAQAARDAASAAAAAAEAALNEALAADVVEDAEFQRIIADLQAALAASNEALAVSQAASQAAADAISPLSDSLNAALQPPAAIEPPPADEPVV